MEVVSDKTFENEEVHVDGKHFVRCVFKNCVLVFSGTPFQGSYTDFGSSSLRFDGPANGTLNFLIALYHHFGDNGRALVEGLFESIRQNKSFAPSDVLDGGGSVN